jgi:hypothetical protein
LKLKRLLIIALYAIILPATAQVPDTLQTENAQIGCAPTPIEIFAGNKSYTFQLIVSKQFSPKSRFGFFNVTNFTGDYKKGSQTADFFSQSLLTAQIWKGISVTTGLSAIGSSSAKSITVRPMAGLQYFLASRNFVVVILPRFDLSQTYNFETFTVWEYKPMLSGVWGIYTRFQGLYNYNTKLVFHEISSIYLRAGLSYKNIAFGIGSNHDFYGPNNHNVNNFGVFIKTDLF